jgi:hypothetical protein
MTIESAIEKLHRIAREKETQKNEHKQRLEKAKLLRKKEAKEELKRVKSIGMLNIQPLAIRLPPHSPSSLECGEGKVYNEKMQFAHTIIQDMYRIGTSIIEFLRKHRRG